MAKRRRAVQMSPQFFKIMLSPHSSKLHIPDEFVRKYGADLQDLVFLEVPSGAIWEVKLQNSNGMKCLKEGWNQFKEYYSIGCGYFLLFQYNGNSHFSVFIFDLSASEIEYPSGPSEGITPENFVNIVGDASQRKKAGGPETQSNVCDDDLLRDKTSKVTEVADHSYAEREKSGIPASPPSCLPERQELNRVKIEKPDVEEELNYATPKDKRKEINEKLVKQNMEKNVYCAADIGDGHCNEVPDPSASKIISTSKCNKRKHSISLEASCCRYPLRSKEVKIEQSKENGSPAYSRKSTPVAPLSCPGTQSEKNESTGVELEKANSEEDFCCTTPKAKREEANKEKLVEQGHCNEVPIVDPSASKVTITNEHSKKKTATSLDASSCRYPLRSKQLQELKIEKEDVEVVDPSATKMTTTNRHHEKKTGVSLDTSNCRYPLRSKQLKEVKLENSNAEEDWLYVAKAEKRKKTTNVKLEKGDVEECNNDIPIVDPSTTKKTTNRHCEKKIGVNLHMSQCRYPLRSKQMSEVKLEQWEGGSIMHSKVPKNELAADSPNFRKQNSGLPAPSPSCQPVRVILEEPDNLFCAAEKSKGKATNNVKLETADMEGSLNSAAYKGKDFTASEMTNTWQEKDITLREAQLGKLPHFIVSMKPSYVSRNFQLDIPDIPVNFFKKYIKEEETIVNLRVSDGRTWRVKLFIQSNSAKIQPSGWREFVLGNSLKEHDTCVFELIDGIEPVLDVTIFRATAPI